MEVLLTDAAPGKPALAPCVNGHNSLPAAPFCNEQGVTQPTAAHYSGDPSTRPTPTPPPLQRLPVSTVM